MQDNFGAFLKIMERAKKHEKLLEGILSEGILNTRITANPKEVTELIQTGKWELKGAYTDSLTELLYILVPARKSL